MTTWRMGRLLRATKFNLLQACLSGDGNFIVVVVAKGTLALVRVVKGDGDGGLSDPGLAVLVHQLLQICGANLSTGCQIVEALNG